MFLHLCALEWVSKVEQSRSKENLNYQNYWLQITICTGRLIQSKFLIFCSYAFLQLYQLFHWCSSKPLFSIVDLLLKRKHFLCLSHFLHVSTAYTVLVVTFSIYVVFNLDALFLYVVSDGVWPICHFSPESFFSSVLQRPYCWTLYDFIYKLVFCCMLKHFYPRISLLFMI